MKVINADCIEAMRTLEPDSIDAIVCDPPYGLGFMGKTWDSTFEAADMPMRRSGAQDAVNAGASRQGGRQRAGRDYQRRMARDSRAFQEWSEQWASEALRILKPGAHLLAFGGTRTYHRLACAVEDAGFEIRDSLLWLYGSGFPKSLDVSKAIDKAAGAEREVVETIPDRWAGEGGVYRRSEQAPAETVNLTAPATPEARQWQGFGTALKPAWESIVWAQKPSGEADTIRRSLWLLEAQLRSLASDAESDSSSRPAELDEAFASAGWTADEQRNTRADLCEAMGTSQFESTLITSLSIVSSWRSTLDGLCELTSTFTTETESRTTTALTTLKSSLSDLTPRTIIQVGTSPDGWRFDALPAVQAFNAVESRLSATRELLAPAPATSKSPDASPAKVEPDAEPIVLARKPLTGTVAANVLEHGTGALNVDGCRVEPSSEYGRSAANSEGRRPKGEGATFPTPERDADYASPLGRWPANVILDPEAGAMLDEQAGERRGAISNSTGDSSWFSERQGTSAQTASGYGDIGGASRFFYCAKASRAERNAGLDSKIGVCRCPRHQADIPHLKGIDAATAEGESDSSTTGSGSRSEDRSPRATKSTTETATKPTTGSKTSSSSPRPSTSESTHLTSDAPATDGSDAALSAASGNRQTPSTSTSTSRAGFSTDAADPATSHESLPTSNGADPLCPDCGGVISGALRNSHPT